MKIIACILLCTISSFAQTPNGPGGVQNTTGTSSLHQWYRADLGITLAVGVVSAWADQSGYGNNLTGPAGFRPATVVDANLNNQTCVAYAGAQYFTSALNGPNVNNITIFLVARGTSYQSLIRFQNNAAVFVVYPWEFGGGRTFISSSDGGTASGIASGLVNNANNVGAARYTINTVNGMQTYLNGTLNAQRTSVNSILPTQPFYSGRYNPGASEYPTCDVGEMIVYFSALNDAEMIMVENYLAAKFNCALTSNDFYTMDNAANGNYDHDVAGIGRVNVSNLITDARGTGIVEILNPTGLGDGKYYLWGDDNGTLGHWNTADYPVGLQGRLVRIWRGSMTGSIPSMDVRFDLTGLGPVTASDLRLLVDMNDNGIFSDETVAGGGVISGASLVAGNVYQFTGVSALTDHLRFTLGTINSTQTPLPIELLSFRATPDASQVDLDWSTATETNNDYFTIERSTNGVDWSEIVRQPGSGTTTSQVNYHAIDPNPFVGTSYYRLKQTD